MRLGLVREENISPVSAIKEASDRYFHLPFAGTSTLNRLKGKVKIYWIHLLENTLSFCLIKKEVEYRIIYKNGKIVISERADVILSKGNEYKVADYKTNRDVYTRGEIEIQIGVYISGLRKSKKDVKVGKIAYLEETELEEIYFDDKKGNK